jgi:hypothetical protein
MGPLLGRVDVDHSPDDSSCEHLPQRLRRLKAVPRRNRHPPRCDLLRMKLRQPTMAESLDGLREQPAQCRSRGRDSWDTAIVDRFIDPGSEGK